MNIFLLLLIFFLTQVLTMAGAILLPIVAPAVAPTPGFEFNVIAMGYIMLIIDLIVILALPYTRLVNDAKFPNWSSHKLSTQVLVLAMTLLLSIGLSIIVGAIGVEDQGMRLLFSGMKSDPIMCTLLLVFIGPWLEELIFREGILRQLMTKYRLSPMLSIFASSLAFAIIHGNLEQGIPAMIMGIMLGILYIVSGDMRLSYFAHVINNALAYVTLYLPEGDVAENIPTPVLIGTGALLCTAAFLLTKKLIPTS